MKTKTGKCFAARMEDVLSTSKKPRLEKLTHNESLNRERNKSCDVKSWDLDKKTNHVEEPGSLIDVELRQFHVLDEVKCNEEGSGSEPEDGFPKSSHLKASIDKQRARRIFNLNENQNREGFRRENGRRIVDIKKTTTRKITAERNKNCDVKSWDLDKKTNHVEEPGSLIDVELRQFHVLDEVKCNEEGSGSEPEDDASTEEDSSDLDLDENELENMLDEPLPEDLKKRKQIPYEEKFKTVLEEKGRNHFDVLPEGWLQVTHNSGIPLYLHKTSRVCTVSRPYFLGPGSVRKHEIPIGAIPCLNYRRALEKENATQRNVANGYNDTTSIIPSIENIQDTVRTPADTANADFVTGAKVNYNGGNKSSQCPIKLSNSQIETVVPAALHNAKIETVSENLKAHSLTAQEVNEYCKQLFHFKTIRVMRFKSWAARRKFTANRRKIKNLQRPTLPDGTKLITFPVLTNDSINGSSGNQRGRKEWIMNPNGKSYVCILHEYVQHALKKQPTYEFKELENASTPYSASVAINNLQYGTGYGTSKKQAKAEAARETLEILIPEMRDKITSANASGNSKNNCKDLSVFDEIKIEDPRVAEFCSKTTEPTPHAILLTCLQRNFGLGDVKINYQVNTLKHKKNEFTVTVGKHTATVVCKNKREGKQLASQAILQILHPHIKTWGSLLRLYGNHSVKSFKEKKQEEQEITILQSKAAINQPNYAILDKLKLEMTKLSNSRAAIKSIGTFIPPKGVELPMASASNLNNVEL